MFISIQLKIVVESFQTIETWKIAYDLSKILEKQPRVSSYS